MSSVLVVDDNADNRYSLRLLLSGYEVFEAAGGEEAVEIARARRPGCVLLDVHMPGMDGFEVCRRLRASEETQSIPIILLTAQHRDTESVVRGLAAGGDEYVTKPVDHQELLARVRAMLRLRELQDRLEVLNAELEDQVSRRTAELQQIYATVPVGIYTLDALGRITSFNRHLQDMLGYEPTEVLERGIAELFGPGYDTLYWLELCRREGRASYEGKARHKDGHLVPVFDERVPRIDPYGEHAGFTGYMQDLTQRARVREILRQQENQAGVGRMSAGIVHEVMNPIAGVTQYLDAMLARLDAGQTIPAEEMRKGAGVMRDALRRASDLVQHLRGFARTAVRPNAAVDPFVILDDLRALFRHDLHQRRIEMVVKGGPGLEVAADEGSLAQVFLNLLTNARDAMPKGGTLTVEVSAEESTARIRFRDTGIGIPRENLARIFDFLYTTKGDKGTGYGLSISRDIVEEYGGRIEVESEEGKGATFTVVLPRGGPAPELRPELRKESA